MTDSISKNTNTISADLSLSVISRLAKDFSNFSSLSEDQIPTQFTYTVEVPEESLEIAQKARLAAFEYLSSTKVLKKVAFDTRRIAENQRIPRENCQFWTRSEEFITEENQRKINAFTKLYENLGELKETHGHLPEWLNSYSRILYDHTERTLRIKQADADIFGSQLIYLEQLLDARYRLNLEMLETLSSEELKHIILKKDESLQKRGVHLAKSLQKNNTSNSSLISESTTTSSSTNNFQKNNNYPNYGMQPMYPFITNGIPSSSPIINFSTVTDSSGTSKNGNGSSENNMWASLFGPQGLSRKDGEKKIERTVTITITDEVKE